MTAEVVNAKTTDRNFGELIGYQMRSLMQNNCAVLLRFPIERGARQVSRPSFTVETPILSLVTALVSIGNILQY